MTTWSIESISDSVAANTKLELHLHELTDLLNRIRSQDRVMRSFLNNHNDLEQRTLEKFAEWTVAHDTAAVQGLLDRIHVLVVGSVDLENFGSVGILQLLDHHMEVNSMLIIM